MQPHSPGMVRSVFEVLDFGVQRSDVTHIVHAVRHLAPHLMMLCSVSCLAIIFWGLA